MSKHIKLSVVLLFGAIIVWLTWRWTQADEPAYQEKSLSVWLEEYNQAGAMDKTVSASEAVRTMGERTLPFLLDRLKKKGDSAGKLRLLLLARRWHVHFLPPPRLAHPHVAPALLALKALGQTAKPAIPELVRMLENPQTTRVGGLGLYSVGADSIPAFEQACEHTNSATRVEAASFLALLPSGYNGDQDYYCTWFKFDAWSRLQAYVARPPSPLLIPALAWRVKNHPNPGVRCACVEALASYYGTAHNDQPELVIRTLRKASNDLDDRVRDTSIACLEKLKSAGVVVGETK